MSQNISQEQILMQQNFEVYLASPYTRIPMLGTIDGTAKEFMLPKDYYSIYPQELRIKPTVADIIVELCKNGVSPSPNTYTVATASALATAPNDYGYDVNAGVTLATAPAAADVDKVVATAYKQFQPVICQSFEPSVKQKQETVGAIGTTDVIYGYGSITNSVKMKMQTSAKSIKCIKDIFNEPDTSGDEVESGYDASGFVPTPKLLQAFMAVHDPETEAIIGFYKFEKCMATPDVPGITDGKAGSFNIDMTVGASPRLLTPTPAV
ncbi:MAG: hypothetical protein K8E24_015155 [Methanobacterium paludis]|nr:hypothetical protein [Methanobacterium paludis]